MVYRDPTPLDPERDYTAEELAKFILEKMYGEHTREAMARSLLKANEVAEWAREVAQQLIDGSFDEGALNTAIEQKLNDLETEYAPQLTNIKNEVEEARGNEPTLGDRLDEFSSQLAQTKKYVDVRNYGATDGMLNDQSLFFEQAINDLNDGDILLVDGEYRIDKKLVIEDKNIDIDFSRATIHNKTQSDFFMEVRGTQGTTQSVTVIDKHTINLSTASHDITTGDFIIIRTNELFNDVVNRAYKKGEIVRVKSISGNVLELFDGGLSLDYSITYPITVNKIDPIRVNVKGLSITGTGSLNKQSGIRLLYNYGSVIEKSYFEGLNAGIDLKSCIGCKVTNNTFKDLDDPIEGYGVVVSSSSTINTVNQNTFDNCRHGFTTGGYDGVCLNNIVDDNTLINCSQYYALNTHGNAKYTQFINNTIRNCKHGILVTSPHSIIRNNTISDIDGYGIRTLEAGSDSVIIENNNLNKVNLKEGTLAIDVVLAIQTPIDTGIIRTCDNTIVSSAEGGGIRFHGDFKVIVCDNNVINSVKYGGIIISKAIHSIVKNNVILNTSRVDQYAISITGSTSSSTADVSENTVPNFAYGVNLKDITLLHLGENLLNVTTNKYTLSNITKRDGRIQGKDTFSGDGNTKIFDIPHSLGQVPNYVNVVPSKIDTLGNFHIRSLTSTHISIEYETAPITGTNNLTFFWEVASE